VPLTGLPTGSLCDGQWHHIAITVPEFTDVNHADYPRFYFDGALVPALSMRGVETLGSSPVFADFSDIGLRLGANGASTPGGFFAGSVDEVAFFARELSAAEMAEWHTARPHPVTPGYALPLSDPNNDGVNNLLSYALGLDPLGAYNPTNLPFPGMSLDHLTLTFPRLRDASDITYRVLATDDLVNWTPIWSSASNPYPGSSPSVWQTVSDPVAIGTPGVTRRFLRLEVRQ
jgi:hypothetical protein